MRFQPQASTRGGPIEAEFLRPPRFIAVAMQGAMMAPT
jgi:hypothetical protein